MKLFHHIEFVQLGDSALLMILGNSIDPAFNRRVLALSKALADFPGLTDLVPAYASLALHYDPLIWTHANLMASLAPYLEEIEGEIHESRLLEIPVCYGGEHGPDLEEVAENVGLRSEEVIVRHSGGEYRVYFLGFTPGFPYLGGLDSKLAMPRMSTPRALVPSGSVGIAGAQTGIYPKDSPGGWRIIGRTPFRLFDPGRQSPCLLAPGDRLRFLPISPEEFDEKVGLA